MIKRAFKLDDEIRNNLLNLELIDDSIASLNINDHESLDQLPLNTSCIYFLTHPKQGILYIGKASDLRGRFRGKNFSGVHTHHRLEAAIKLKNVRLSWVDCLEPAKTIIEMLLIRNLKPAWNIEYNKIK